METGVVMTRNSKVCVNERTSDVPPRYNLLSDEANCRLAQAGDQVAVSMLLRRHDRWIRRCADDWNVPDHDEEDVYSLALVGAVQAIHAYDPSRSLRLPTYIWYGVRRECEQAIRGLMRQKRGNEVAHVSLHRIAIDDTYVPEPLVVGSAEKQALAQIEGARLMDVVTKAVGGYRYDRNIAVLDGLLTGDGARITAAKVGLSRQYVCRIRERARESIERDRCL